MISGWCALLSQRALAEDLRNLPALGATEGASFLNAYSIASFTLVFFVVGFVLFGADDYFAIFGVGGTVFHCYHYSFLHFVADDQTD
jgi:hypothetical protein